MALSSQSQYQDNSTSNLNFGSVASEVANPVNWLLYSPGMYSVTKGDMKLPRFLRPSHGMANQKSLARISRLWGAQGARGKFSLASKLMGTVSEFGKLGGLTFGKEKVIKGRNIGIKNLTTKGVAWRNTLNSRIRSAWDNEIYTPGKHYIVRPSQIQMGKALGKERVTQIAQQLTIDRARILKKLVNKGKPAGWARAGVIAGKGVSAFMIGSLLWSVAGAITEPMGRNAMSKIDQGLSRFEQRNLPELTRSQLKASYLTAGAATERQRAIEALSKASLNGRSAFGNEAQYMHQ